MCDYSLRSVKSRPAKVGDKLITRDFGTGTRGFAASEIRPSQFAYCREQSCLLRAMLRVYRPVCCLGVTE